MSQNLHMSLLIVAAMIAFIAVAIVACKFAHWASTKLEPERHRDKF